MKTFQRASVCALAGLFGHWLPEDLPDDGDDGDDDDGDGDGDDDIVVPWQDWPTSKRKITVRSTISDDQQKLKNCKCRLSLKLWVLLFCQVSRHRAVVFCLGHFHWVVKFRWIMFAHFVFWFNLNDHCIVKSDFWLLLARRLETNWSDHKHKVETTPRLLSVYMYQHREVTSQQGRELEQHWLNIFMVPIVCPLGSILCRWRQCSLFTREARRPGGVAESS